VPAVIEKLETQLPLLLSTRDLSQLTGLSEATFEKARCEGRGPDYLVLGNHTVRYTVEAFYRWAFEKQRKLSEKQQKDVE
jgi:hypothetical protein